MLFKIIYNKKKTYVYVYVYVYIYIKNNKITK